MIENLNKKSYFSYYKESVSVILQCVDIGFTADCINLIYWTLKAVMSGSNEHYNTIISSDPDFGQATEN